MALPPPKPPARKRKMPERKKLNVGQFIASEKDAYKIESILGSGGFGDVYKVVCVKDEQKKYAMKTEYFDPRKRKLLNRLKDVFLKSETEIQVEMGVFTEIQNAPPARKKHFIQMVDKGQTDLFKFIVMEIVSHSLEDIRKYMLSGKLTWQTAIKVASQTLTAISDLHSVGYIHRDIKPHNFAIGRPPMHSQIYMLDFGIARRYTEKDGKIRVPRERVTFLGTVKFASRMCHLEQEQSRKDDLEVWIYMVLELFEQENLIWRRQTDRTQILQLKERLFTHTDDLDLRAPIGFKKIMEIVKKLNFADEPDYAQLDSLLWACAKDAKLDMSVQFDWIDKVMPEKTKPKKKAPAARLENDDDSADRRRRKRREEKAKKAEAENDVKKDVSEGYRPSEGKDSKDGKEKKEGEEEDEDEEDEDEESKDKKGSQGRLSGEGGTGRHRKSLSRNTKKTKTAKETKNSKDSKDHKEVDVDPGKKASGEKFDRDEKEKGRDKHGQSKMNTYKKEKREDAGASKVSKIEKVSTRQKTSDAPGSHKKSDTDVKKGSDKKVSERKRGSGRSGKRNHSKRGGSGKKKQSDKEKLKVAGPPSGPPPQNVSVMIGPQDENFVRSGYISIDMGKGKK
ncbi:hypothetical protein PRIPAC_88682 [Pristionchus pacificus]|uniref:Protein kinase domain-containing protein n=1 Tax=Pristionchus pacificus TaxID=54126 RepID=A0A2A6CYV7_PRIPA|nr:hypothetical protein PRIPAC_88682 [Pristionchus pacificus]|eukprot:PDM83203.1 protein kinase [Pristionchus pacificus]